MIGSGLKIGFVQLHHVDAGFEQSPDLLIDRCCIVHREGFGAGVIVVLRLLGHGEGTRDGQFDRLGRMALQEGNILNLNGANPANGTNHARHRIGLAGAVNGGAVIVRIDAA